jgi:hypothetical protein
LCALWNLAGQKAGSAIYRSSLRRIEGDGCLLSALRTLDRYFNALTDSGCLGSSNCGEAFVLCLFAGFTPLGFVLQTLIVKKDLLTSRPNEIFSAVYTFYIGILEFHFGLAPLTI